MAPTITLKGSSKVVVTKGKPFVDAGATALDPEDGDVTDLIVAVNPVDINTLGTYTVTYNVSDVSGNKATQVTRTVEVTPFDALQGLEASKLKVYPNPSNGQFTVDADATYTLDIFDVMGVKVYSKIVEPSINSVDLGSLKGFYLLKIYNNTNSYSSKIEVQ